MPSLRRTNIYNIASEHLLKKNKSKQIKKLVKVRDTWDIFGQLLYLKARKQVCYALLPKPPYFAHPDVSFTRKK